MTYDTAKKLTGITEQTGVLALEVSDDNFETVLSAVSEIAERNGKIEVNTIEQTIASIQKYYSPTIKTFYMISAILICLCGTSLMNMLMVDLQNRKREFGLLRAVGTTQNQLRKMLNRELMIYLAGSLLIALVVSPLQVSLPAKDWMRQIIVSVSPSLGCSFWPLLFCLWLFTSCFLYTRQAN